MKLFLFTLLVNICLSNQTKRNTDPDSSYSKDSEYYTGKIIRCFILPSENNMVNGHLRLYQNSPDSKVLFNIEIFNPHIKGISIYSKKSNNYSCYDLGEEIVKLSLNNTELYSIENKIETEGVIENFSLYDPNVLNYSCVGFVDYSIDIGLKNNLIENKNPNKEEEIVLAGCGNLQHYEILSPSKLGYVLVWSFASLGILYFYFYGV